jgi:hypothetical protein
VFFPHIPEINSVVIKLKKTDDPVAIGFLCAVDIIVVAQHLAILRRGF